jgi:hypothetical protein
VKVACTVATGGMEKRAVGTALCPYPLDRHQLDEPPGPHSAQNEALNVPESRYANSRGYTDLVRSASFPTRVNGILARFAQLVCLQVDVIVARITPVTRHDEALAFFL